MSFFRNIWNSGVCRAVGLQQFTLKYAQVNQQSLRSVCLMPGQNTAERFEHCLSPLTGTLQFLGQIKTSGSQFAYQCIREKNTGKRIYYRGSAWKRYNKHNIERRLTTDGGLEVLWRKTLKGKHKLASYERILPNTVNGRILPDHLFKFQKHPVTKQKLPKPGLF
ncbi:hypothetical protein Btru_048925 [Bulinus truncatus]|nr:hypothetical protein Btru_048925 [Bulinus truncatus]